jgi:predicted Zn-dependent peptidase
MSKNIVAILFLISLGVQAQIDRSTMPKPGPPPEIKLGTPQRFELKNGLKVIVVADHKLPRVSMQLTLDNPPIVEGDKAGVSSLVAGLLGNGSKNISKDAFNEEVDFLGARISFGAQSASASTLSKYFPRILELMADAAISPNFTADDFDTEKARLITSIKSQENDVQAIADRLQNTLTYGTGHPYGEYTSEATLGQVSLADVEKFYREHFVPANAYLVVIGDVDFGDVKELVNTYFTPWTRAVPPSFSYTRPSDSQFAQINFTDMPNAVQSEIRVTNLADLQMNAEDYLPAILANRIFGGGFQSRLNQNIREDKGYAYYAYSSLGNDKYAPATFSAVTSVRNAVTDSAVVQILQELDSVTLPTITGEELENAKAEYTGSFVMALEKPETIAKYALNIETENLPGDFYNTYLERLNAVSVAQVQKAAEKYIKPGNARIVIAGKGSEVIPALEAIQINGRGIPLRFYDKQAMPVEKPANKISVPSGVTLQTVINDYFSAIGGIDVIEGVNSLKLVYQGEAMGSSIKTVEHRTTDKFAQTTYMNDSPMMGVVAKEGEIYMKQNGNKLPLPPAMQQDLKKMLGIFPELMIYENPGARLAGIEKIEDNDAYRIDVPGELVQASFYYDVKSGLKLKEATVVSINGQTQNQEVFYKEYKEHEGLLLPDMRISTLGPQQLESKLTEVKINEAVSESDFE